MIRLNINIPLVCGLIGSKKGECYECGEAVHFIDDRRHNKKDKGRKDLQE